MGRVSNVVRTVAGLSVAIAGVTLVDASPSGADHVCTAEILLVAGSSPHPSGDDSIFEALDDRVPDAGCVTVVADDDVTEAQAEGFDVVVITSSVQPSVLGSRLRDAAVPILVSEPFLFDDMSMVPARSGKELAGRTTVRITDPGHPLAGGLTGTVSVFSSAAKVNYGIDGAAPGVEPVANTGGSSPRMTIFGFAPGSQLIDRTAAGGRVGFFASYGADLNGNGVTLLNAAVDWLLGPPALACGDVITTDLVLDRDLLDCPGAGLVVGADDITIDLNGHTIDGSAAAKTAGEEGIDAGSFDGVTVRNGTIRDFFYGVEGFGEGNTFEDLLFIDNAASFEFVAAHDNTVRNNISTAADFHFLRLTFSDRNVVEGNVSTQSRFGVVVSNSDGNQVLSNELSGLGRDRGVVIGDGASGTVVRGNDIESFEFGIQVVDASGTGVFDNSTTMNDVDGIRVELGATDTTIGGNSANDNGEWGIRALASVTDAGGNSALGNGLGQCQGVVCLSKPPLRALMVAGSTVPPRGDRDLVDIIEAKGILLDIADDESDLGSLDLSPYAFVFVTSSVKPAVVGDTFKDAAIPVILSEGFLFDNMAMSASGETTKTRTQVTVVAPDDPLAAGFPAGNQRVYTTAEKLSFGEPSADATVVAHEPGKPQNAVIFSYDPGDILVDGTPAAGHRVGLFPTYQGAQVLNGSGVAFVDAAVQWVLDGGPPGNDDFADRFVAGLGASFGDNVGATTEDAEPSPFFGQEGSVWWDFTATSDGAVVVDTNGSSFDTVLAAWTGVELATLDLLRADDDSGDGLASRVTFPVSAGAEYRIAVYGFAGRRGDIQLNIAETDVPVNDNFADRILIGPGVSYGTTDNATLEVGEPEPGGDMMQSSVWYEYTASADGVTILSVDAEFIPQLGVWDGTELGSLVEVASGPPGGFGRRVEVAFATNAGMTYHVAVYSQNWDGSGGDFELELLELPSPTNDDFADRIPLVLGTTETANVGATVEPNEPALTGVNTLWWEWTAPVDGTYVIDTNASGFSSTFTLWSGDSLDTLVEVATAEDDYEIDVGPQSKRLQFEALAGDTYKMSVGGIAGFENASGRLQINVLGVGELVRTELDPEAPNAVDMELDAAGNPVVASIDGATGEARVLHCNDAVCAGGDDVAEVIGTDADPFGDIAITLGAGGLPVVVFVSDTAVEVVRCDDADCAGGGETRNSLPFDVGEADVVVDALDNPVIATGGHGGDLQLIHCNDMFCAGGDESVEVIDQGFAPTLELDADGFPVIAYGYNEVLDADAGVSFGRTLLAHCNDADCSGGDESIRGVSSGDWVGEPSMYLDGTGNPVVANSYDSFIFTGVRLTSCGDAACTESSTVQIDEFNWVDVPATAAGPNGNPMVAYNQDGDGPKVAFCNDADCSGQSAVELEPPGTFQESRGSAIAVDPAGDVVVVFIDQGSDPALRLVRLVGLEVG